MSTDDEARAIEAEKQRYLAAERATLDATARLYKAAPRMLAALRAIVNHWHEFGPEHGFDELIVTVAEPVIAEAIGATEPTTTEPA